MGCGSLESVYSLINRPDDHLVTACVNLDFRWLPLERASPCLMELGCKLILLVGLWLLLIWHGFTSFIYSLCPHFLAPGLSLGAWCKHVIRNPSRSFMSEDGNCLLSPEKGGHGHSLPIANLQCHSDSQTLSIVGTGKNSFSLLGMQSLKRGKHWKHQRLVQCLEVPVKCLWGGRKIWMSFFPSPRLGWEEHSPTPCHHSRVTHLDA